MILNSITHFTIIYRIYNLDNVSRKKTRMLTKIRKHRVNDTGDLCNIIILEHATK